MILLEEDSLQRPKLPTDPFVGPTNRAPSQANAVAPGSFERPPSPNPTLPDYEALQAQQSSPHKRSFYRRLWHTRVGKLVSYALAIYSAVFVVIGVPAFVQKWRSSHKFRWHGDDSFLDYGPPPRPPLPRLSEVDLSSQNVGNSSFSCNAWTEPGDIHGELDTAAAVGSMHLAFPLGEEIILRTNPSSNNLKDYVSGSLRVDMNPDRNVPDIVLAASTRCSSLQLLKASSVCLSNFGNTTELIIHIPDREDSHLDTMDMNLQLLLPWTPAPIDFKTFATRLPMFNQSFGDLRPHVAFRQFKLVGSNSTVAVGSVRASSIAVQTSGAEISGNFSASENILLDNINGAIYTNVLLLDNQKSREPTKLRLETGNGPIVAQVNLQVDERRYFSIPPDRPNFISTFKTYNAPMNVSIAHVARSEAARFKIVAENTQGALAMTLDSVYAGVFELRTRAATTLVQETPAAPGTTDSSPGEEHELHFEHVSSEWTRGWIGDDRRPEEHLRHKVSRVKLVNSLSPIELQLARLRPSTAIRR